MERLWLILYYYSKISVVSCCFCNYKTMLTWHNKCSKVHIISQPMYNESESFKTINTNVLKCKYKRCSLSTKLILTTACYLAFNFLREICDLEIFSFWFKEKNLVPVKNILFNVITELKRAFNMISLNLLWSLDKTRALPHQKSYLVIRIQRREHITMFK